MTIVYPDNYACSATECSVGTGISEYYNAFNSNKNGIVVIPKYHEELPVTSIGKYAFRFAREITEVKIEARIEYIEERAFSDMNGLQKINIPSSVKRIGNYGLQFSAGGTTQGTVFITFEAKSLLEYIGNEVFGFKTKVVILFTGNKSPQCASNAFTGTKIIQIYSPTSFKFCGIYQTSVLSTVSSSISSRKVILYSIIIAILLANNIKEVFYYDGCQ